MRCILLYRTPCGNICFSACYAYCSTLVHVTPKQEYISCDFTTNCKSTLNLSRLKFPKSLFRLCSLVLIELNSLIYSRSASYNLDRCNNLINLLLSLLRIPSVIGEATIELDTVLSHLIRPESGQSMQPTVIFEAASHSSIFFHKFHFRTNTPAAIKYEPPLTRSR
jgi:hypothetical protein